MKALDFDNFWKEQKSELINLIDKIKIMNNSGYLKETDDFQITISVNDNLDDWNYQTGDNSFTGSCYHHPYWGVSSISKDCNPEDIALALILDLASVIGFED